MSFNGDQDGGCGQRDVFPTTRWSVVLDAQCDDADALSAFCRSYWYPLYSDARRKGIDHADAEDLTQAFFERFLSREALQTARRERGRMRGFLLSSFRNFMAEDWRKRGATKRGGHRSAVSVDMLAAEERFTVEAAGDATPELEYERAWARELLRRTVERLRKTYELTGNGRLFQVLKDQLVDGSPARPYADIAKELGLSEESARFAAFKLRQRYRATLKELVGETVASSEEVADELAHLLTLFRK